MRLKHRSTVVLPHPDGPMNAVTSCWRIGSGHVAHRPERAVVDGQVLHVEDDRIVVVGGRGLDDRGHVDGEIDVGPVSQLSVCLGHVVYLFHSGLSSADLRKRAVTNRASSVSTRTITISVRAAPQASGSPPGWVALEKIWVERAVFC